jgi:hypothetical protein
VGLDGVAEGSADDALILEAAGYEVFRDYDADGGGHADLSWRARIGMWAGEC